MRICKFSLFICHFDAIAIVVTSSVRIVEPLSDQKAYSKSNYQQHSDSIELFLATNSFRG